jgi:hypothetical protein
MRGTLRKSVPYVFALLAGALAAIIVAAIALYAAQS